MERIKGERRKERIKVNNQTRYGKNGDNLKENEKEKVKRKEGRKRKVKEGMGSWVKGRERKKGTKEREGRGGGDVERIGKEV